MDKQAELIRRLLATFQVEAQEHLQTMAACLVKLENAPTDQRPASVEAAFRAAHSLKGAARAVNLAEAESACHLLEEVFALWKRQGAPSVATSYDGLHRALDLLAQIVGGLDSKAPPSAANAPARSLERFEQLLREQLLNPGPASEGPAIASPAANGSSAEPARVEVARIEPATPRPPSPSASAPPPRPSAAALTAPTPAPPEKPLLETIRVSASKLDNLLLQTEELLGTKQAAAHLAAELRGLQRRCADWRKTWARVQPVLRSAEKHAGSPDDAAPWSQLLAFMEWNRQFIESFTAALATSSQVAGNNHRTAAVLIDSLTDEVKNVLMRPFVTAFEGLPRLARDLARGVGKEVELQLQGGEIEMDRRILEELKDPLTHLIRNAVDHGIEPPAERERKQKKPRGTILVAIEPIGGREVELTVTDDGGGLDHSRVREAALQQGLLDPGQAEALNDQAVLALIFQSGFSTSPIVTDLSGRGLGLAIVREKVEKLGGRIAVENRPGQGIVFRMRLPTMRAAFRGVIVRVGQELFVFPTAGVERVARVRWDEIRTIEGYPSIRLNGRWIALARLEDLLGVSLVAPKQEADVFPVVVACAQGQTMAFAVSEVINEHEVLVRSLGPQLVRVRNIEAATVLAGGRLVPILHLPDLMRAAAAGGHPHAPPAEAAQTAAQKRILVVEDSITSRTLLKNILEGAHFDVQTAVDGLDGLAKLRETQFDLVVSDVEMPRLHGFDLTARIRADSRLAQLPVVLVTARESREDREKGIEVGANAYIVKSSFDQSNLLEVIQRFI